MTNRNRWQRLGYKSAPFVISGLLVAVVLLIALGVLPVPGGGDEVHAAADDICKAELGDEWENSGIATHPDWSHAHIECERSTGILRTEEQWVSVPSDELPLAVTSGDLPPLPR